MKNLGQRVRRTNHEKQNSTSQIIVPQKKENHQRHVTQIDLDAEIIKLRLEIANKDKDYSSLKEEFDRIREDQGTTKSKGSSLQSEPVTVKKNKGFERKEQLPSEENGATGGTNIAVIK